MTFKKFKVIDVSCERAFERLKEALVQYPILRIPIDDAPFRVECDSSDYANGAILSQFIDSKWHPVAYRSRTLSETEHNYEIHDKELLAIMDSLSDWRQYLMGAQHRFEIWTDHKNLQYFRKPQKLNRRQARWQTELQEYDFLLVHKPGAQMKKADLLTRRADFQAGRQDNSDIVLLKEDAFTRAIQVEPIA